ncbi:MAG: hypothetical protein ACYCY2_01010 [Acidithiobacillus ferriphilus]
MSKPDFLVLRRGIVYEGDDSQLWALYPSPMISPAECDFIKESSNGQQKLVIREDSFDSISRIRRCRFYFQWGSRGRKAWNLQFVCNGIYGSMVGIAGGDFDEDDSCKIARLNNEQKTPVNKLVRIGGEPYAQEWKVVSVETNQWGHQVFTLKARSSFGAVPNLKDDPNNVNGDQLNEEAIKSLEQSIDNLVDAIHHQQPISVVDVARETTRVILAAWVGEPAREKDLGNIIKLHTVQGKKVLCSSAFIINRMHPRGKTAERESQAVNGNMIRQVTDEDADVTVYLVGMILREIGWAAL